MLILHLVSPMQLFNYLKGYIAKVLTPVITNGDVQEIANNIANFERELAFVRN